MDKSFTDKMGYKSPFEDSSNDSPESDIQPIITTSDIVVLARINQEKQDAKEKEEKEKQLQPKNEINLLIFLEKDASHQIESVINEIWTLKTLKSFEEIDTIRGFIKNNTFSNICLVHHGNTFSDHTLKGEEKIVLSANIMDAINKTIQNIDVKSNDITNDFIDKVFQKSKYLYKNGLSVKDIKAYFSLKLLIGNIRDGGCFLSVACNEADDINFLIQLSNFTDKNIKLFANSNYSTISDDGSIIFSYNDFKVNIKRSIFNSFISDGNYWSDSSGWKYFDTLSKKIIITKKDLWIFSSNKEKVFDLVQRKKELTKEQFNEERNAQIVYSKIFQQEYIKRYKKEAYENYKKNVKKSYPRI